MKNSEPSPSSSPWSMDLSPQWRWVPLRWLLTRNDGGVWGTDANDGEGTTVLRSTDVTVGGEWNLNAPASRSLTPEEKAAGRVRMGDLIVTKSSGSPLHLGKTALVDDDLERQGCCFSNFMQRLRPGPDLQPRFAFWFINSSLGREQMNFWGTTTTGLANLNGWVLGMISVTLPPAAIQTAIAAYLDRETAKIDVLVIKKERLIELLQEKRSALISHVVSRGLDPAVPTKESGVGWLGPVPAHWRTSRIRWIARMESGHTPDKKIDAYWTDCDIPWVSLNDTSYLAGHDYITETSNYVNALGIANSSARVLPARAVVFSRDATIGRCAITTRPMAVSQHFIAWLCGDGLVPEYLLFVLRAMHQELERVTMGATLKTIGMPDVKRLAIPVPPVHEQMQIAEHIMAKTARIDALVAKVREAIGRLKEYRSALITAAVTGQIDVGRKPS